MGARETRGICGRWTFINKVAGKKISSYESLAIRIDR